MNNKVKPAPFVSVIMACYNAEHWLNESIASVLNQTYPDFELIAVDDGSTDNTLSILHRFADIDRRTVVFSKPNTGPGDTRNFGISKSCGKWIAIIDADDIWDSKRLEKQIQASTLVENLVYLGTGLQLIDNEGNTGKIVKYPSDHFSLVRHLVTARKFPPHSSALYLGEAIRRIEGFRSRIHRAEDLDLWLRLSEVGKLGSLRETLVKIRKHPAQISHDENGRRQVFDSKLAIISYWVRRYNMPDPIEADTEIFECFCSWVRARMHENQIGEFHEYKRLIKTLLSDVKDSYSVAPKLLNCCFGNFNFLLRLIKEYFVGESSSRHLALGWIDYTKSFK